MSHSISEIEKPIIFRSYIGVKPYPETLNEYPGQIINENVEQFHFIVGFAKETLDGDGYGTGIFGVNWNLQFFGLDKVLSLKRSHPRAKVILSIGGNDHEFNPRDKDAWVNQAVESIKRILEGYKFNNFNTIDGIDINYQFINLKLEPQDFSYCIGSVITQLKDAQPLVNVDNVVSIAPSDSVQRYYQQLYSDYQNSIKWVCYQFYHQKEPVQTVDNFVELYGRIVNDYARGVVLAGGSSDPDNKDKIPQPIFLKGCRQLISQGDLPGIFVWNANDSDILHQNERFVLESRAQELFPTQH